MSKEKSTPEPTKEQAATHEKGALENKETPSEGTAKEKKQVEKTTAKKPVAKSALPELGKDNTHRVLCSSLTSRRGVLVKDQGCRSNDFPGGAAQLDEMVAKKLIQKV